MTQLSLCKEIQVHIISIDSDVTLTLLSICVRGHGTATVLKGIVMSSATGYQVQPPCQRGCGR